MEAGAWSCGMVVGLIHDIPTCQELIDGIMAEANAIIRTRLPGLPVMSDAPVLYAVADGVATITLNRPEKLNALTPDMLSQFFAAVAAASEDPAAKVIVVTGAGRSFSAGLDLGVDRAGGVRARWRRIRRTARNGAMISARRWRLITVAAGRC